MGGLCRRPLIAPHPSGIKQFVAAALVLAGRHLAAQITRSLTPLFCNLYIAACGLAALLPEWQGTPGSGFVTERIAMPTKTAAKAAAKDAPEGSRPNALKRPLQPSPELAAVVGPHPLPRTEAVSRVWEYIKKHQLQNPENRREILADATLRKVFGQDKVTMFELSKHLAQHLK